MLLLRSHRPSAFWKFCASLFSRPFSGNLLDVYFPSLSHSIRQVLTRGISFFFFPPPLSAMSQLMLIHAVPRHALTTSSSSHFNHLRGLKSAWKSHYTINTASPSAPCLLLCTWIPFSPLNNTVSMSGPLKQDEFPSSAGQEAGRNFFFFLNFVSLMTHFWIASCMPSPFFSMRSDPLRVKKSSFVVCWYVILSEYVFALLMIFSFLFPKM